MATKDELYESYLTNAIDNLELDLIEDSNIEIPQSSDSLYRQWLAQNYPKRIDLEIMKANLGRLSYQPKVSVIMPVYNTPEVFLRAAIESVMEQVYPHWELYQPEIAFSRQPSRIMRGNLPACSCQSS
ncbi:MAG: hypothetical protein HC767_04480 [Akkermansiaceae bacterium]|nr:hypothetical protein [Akkermansiaceae bacterium]